MIIDNGLILSILMNIINQATVYLPGESKNDLVYTMNITSMMVLASIYLSVSHSLPSTPNIKPVEIWLLFNLAYPFLVIIVNVLLQVRQETLHLYVSFSRDGSMSRSTAPTGRRKLTGGKLGRRKENLKCLCPSRY